MRPGRCSMAHEVQTMFSVGVAPWHGLGHVLDRAPSVAEAIKLAGLDWTVSLRPMWTTLEGGSTPIPVPGQRAGSRRALSAMPAVPALPVARPAPMW